MVAMPCPDGPRHSGQSAAATFKQQTDRQRRVREIMRRTQRIKARAFHGFFTGVGFGSSFGVPGQSGAVFLAFQSSQAFESSATSCGCSAAIFLVSLMSASRSKSCQPDCV
ncbi:MAG: hypothetical protein ACK55I_26080, partial [bacterium]